MRRVTTAVALLTGACVIALLASARAEQAQRGIVVVPKVVAGSVPIKGEYWALIVGINKYLYAPPLDTAVKDAVGVRDVLLSRYGFRRDHLIELLDGQATRTNIEDALFRLGHQAGEDDSVFIYYAGHGQYDEEDRLGWWVPVEGQPKKPGTFITNASIRDYVEGMKARHVYLVADSCFSGTLFGKARAMPPLDDKFFERLYVKKSRWGLTSGGTEPVDDQGKDGHSIFAYHFINLLKENANPYLIPSHIFDQLAPLIANNADQVPRSEPMKGAGDEGGQFVFRLAAVPGDKAAVGKAPSAPAAGGSSAEVAELRKELDDIKRQMGKANPEEDQPSGSAASQPAPTPNAGGGAPGGAGQLSAQQFQHWQRMAHILDTARQAAQDQWPQQKKRILARLEDRMKEENSTNRAAIEQALAALGKVLEDARAMPDDNFKSQRARLTQTMVQTMASGMGRLSQ